MQKVNTWITGIHLHEYETDMPDGTTLGFDADFGTMVAYKGKLVTASEYGAAAGMYKIVKVFRDNDEKLLLHELIPNEAEAQKIVALYPDKKKSMVVYSKYV